MYVKVHNYNVVFILCPFWTIFETDQYHESPNLGHCIITKDGYVYITYMGAFDHPNKLYRCT